MTRGRRAWTAAGALSVLCAVAAIAIPRSTRNTDVLKHRSALLEIEPARIDAVAAARIVFAHQSVGDDIVLGLADLGALRLVDIGKKAAPQSGAVFAHARLGVNGNPRSKTDAFVELLETGLGSRVDIALQKYCFVDITAGTDVDALFEYYRQAMARLRHDFPALTLVHVTTPLMQAQAGVRADVKKMLGRMPDHYADNFARERFNERLIREYAGREPVFDLAAVESSRPETGTEFISFRRMRGRTLLPEYTTDGGHLSEQGRNRVARELVRLLGRVIGERSAGGAHTR